MQEQLFLWESFLRYAAGESARRDFFELPGGREALASEFENCEEALRFLHLVITPTFEELPELRPALAHCLKGALPSLGEVHGVYKSLGQWEALAILNNEEFPLLQKLYEEIPLPPLGNIWAHTFEQDGSLADGASAELKHIRGLKKSLRRRIEKFLQASFQSEDIAEKHAALREGRYVLPYKASAKNRIGGIVHGYSATGQTAYIEPAEIVQWNNELLEVDDREQREIERLLRQWCGILASHQRELDYLFTRMAYLEILFAKARFAKDYKAVFPKIASQNTITLLEAYNPFLLLKKGRRETVPIDFKVEEGCKGVIISGPNAGGKSAALKTLALFSTMMRHGLPVTARAAELPYFEQVLIEMGDQQSLDNALSTFSAHLTNLKNILQSAGKHTLIIIDEIAHATDPIEGEALASAVIDALLATGAFFAVSTHYRGVKHKALSQDNIKIYAASFDQNYAPLYTLAENAVGESYALKIAERIGLDYKILKNAEEIMEGSRDEKEAILANIGAFESRLQNREQQLARKELLLLEEESRFHGERESFEEEKRAIQAQGLAALDRELSSRLKELSAFHRTLKSDAKKAEGLLGETRELVQQRKKAQIETLRKRPKELKIGQEVFAASLGRNARIEEIYTHEVCLRAGIFKCTVPREELFEGDAPPPPRRSPRPAVQAFPSIDLRGKLVAEALPQLESALHRALNAGLEEFSVIHGKGTGALQRAVQDFVKNLPEVAESNFALPQDGGSGKTIVKFK